ncbi:MAG: glycosyltransferase, partial [Holophagales bacterium]|nr:glycosyltransferase [Holophagales bacterium]
MSPSPQALPAPPIHLLWIGDGAPDWPLGQVERAPDETAAEIRGAGDRLIRRIEDAGREERDGMLLWSCHLGPPDPETVARIFRQPGELWHAGPLLGQAGRPRLLGFVHPTWMLLLDPPADRPASSWRLSPRACLLHTRHWRELGGPPSGGYRSCGAAFLEWGHRWLTLGVLCRHTPELLGSASIPGVWAGEEPLCARDELLFLHRRAGPRWTAWAAGRALLTGVLGPIELLRSWRRSRQAAGMSPARPEPLPSFSDGALPLDLPRVTVLVPTLGRYPYLRTLLEQLSRQTVPPLEVLVIDQTEPEARQRDWLGAVPDLPVRLLERPRPGQSSARNAGLRQARGDAVLFLDDDDEIPRELIERHLRALEASGADAICGVAEEAGTGPLPSEFRRRRISDVFPTNNALVRRRALEASGLFDLAFDTGARADLDLGF